jgi:hypothetical protein
MLNLWLAYYARGFAAGVELTLCPPQPLLIEKLMLKLRTKAQN